MKRGRCGCFDGLPYLLQAWTIAEVDEMAGTTAIGGAKPWLLNDPNLGE